MNNYVVKLFKKVEQENDHLWGEGNRQTVMR
jgi:hypothetical protein